MMDEQSLIAQAQRGDLHAFNQLVLAYQSTLYNVAYRILGDSDAAADATQDAFVSAYKAIARFRGGSFKAWLLRIVTNACYDQLRVKQRRPTDSLDDMLVEPEHDATLRDDSESPEDFVLRQELGAAIQQGLSVLPPDQRITLVLSDIEGLSYEEIAQATQVSLGTVKSRLSRARSKLRDYLLHNGELLPAAYRLQGGTG
ncbi:MAG: sigma-70 family RNA polymerase sigma factor [Chloroflexi bacterium]|nr:sigma-70 family RNA polymerase sigma factor [Chloroflexota bacterium]